MPVPRISRRQLLVLGAAGTLAGGASAAAATPPVTDSELVSYGLEIELLSVFAYEHVLGLPGAPAGAQSMLTQFLGHERRHVTALESELHALGAPAPQPVDSVARANELLKEHGLSTDVGSVRTFKDGVKLLFDVEGLSQGAYHAMAGLLRSQPPLLPAVQALACEAQHEALLTLLLLPGKVELAIPSAFVEGWQ